MKQCKETACKTKYNIYLHIYNKCKKGDADHMCKMKTLRFFGILGSIDAHHL